MVEAQGLEPWTR